MAMHALVNFTSRDLASWLNSITSLVSSDELATDVSRAEALLERHQVIQLLPCHHHFNTFLHVSQEQRVEIDAHAAIFQTFESFGLQLLANDHYASPEINDKLQIIKTERENIERLVICIMVFN